MKFAFVAAERVNHAVSTLCRVIGASRRGFYAWLHGAPARDRRQAGQAELEGHVDRLFSANRCIYGSKRIHAALRREGRRHSERRVARTMRTLGLSARRGRKAAPRTTQSGHGLAPSPNLLGRRFEADRPDRIWLGDITYVPTGEGWLYLATVKDMATRGIVGWAMADHLRASLCQDALLMAIRQYRPEVGLIFHSDRGVQYAETMYRAILQRHGIRQSMSRCGNCLDNAPMESFFASLKIEMVHGAVFPTRDAAKAALFDYIEVFYNRRRLHSAIGYRTPSEARRDLTTDLAIAA